MNHNARPHNATLSPYEAASSITALTLGGATITLDLRNAPPRTAHWFVAVEYYSNSSGTVATPGAGTATFTVATGLIPGTFQSLEWNKQSLGGGVVAGASNEQVDFDSASVQQVRVVLAGITVATHVRLRVTGVGV